MTVFYAHSVEGQSQSCWQRLQVHLEEVSLLAKKMATNACKNDEVLSQTAELAGIIHDLGKYQRLWQEGIKTESQSLPPHAIHGAAFAKWVLNSDLLAFVIAGHHAGLHDSDVLGNNLNCQESSDLQRALDLIRASAQTDLSASWPTTPPPMWKPETEDENEANRRLEFWTRILFSILVDADRLNTEKFAEQQRADQFLQQEKGAFKTLREQTQVKLCPHELLGKLEQARAARAAGREHEGLVKLRNQVFAACREKGFLHRQGLFELTVPTGGGKTLAAMAFALAHAQKHELRRIIVVIPYLSIIEQNAGEYRKILGARNLIEHHSAVGDEEPVPENRDAKKAEDLATENWDAPIIVTTAVQFLESLLACSPKRCRKLHNIARSVVVFDEAQAMPTFFLNPLLNVFRELARHYGVSFVFSTATQPAFQKSYGLKEGFKKGELEPILLPSLRDQLFKDLRRVRYRVLLDQPWNWETLSDRLLETNQALCVLNVRRHAKELWQLLRTKAVGKFGSDAAAGVLHLSSAMCAEHRLDLLGRKENPLPGSVRYRLLHGLPCWLISTQVIEAGVDVDFPRAFRALGPLDSIVQVAGRCNREGKQPQLGEVIVFQPADEGMPPGIYQTATGKAKTFLGEISEEQLACDPTVFARYFSEIYKTASTDAKNIQADRENLYYRRVAEKARIITDGGHAVIVPYGKAKRLIRAIQKSRFYDRGTLRKLQRFLVNVRPNDFFALQNLGSLTPLMEGGNLMSLANYSYDQNLGVLIQGIPLQDFIQ